MTKGENARCGMRDGRCQRACEHGGRVLSECVYSWMLRNAPPGARCGSSSRRDIDRNSHRGKAMSLSASQALAARRSRVAIPEDALFVGVAGNKKEMTTVGRFPGVAATACLLRMRRTA